MSKTDAVKVFICNCCKKLLKVYHLEFSAVKCTNCDNVITLKQIIKESKA